MSFGFGFSFPAWIVLSLSGGTPPVTGFSVLGADGTAYSVALAVLGADGTSYTVSSTVLGADGTSYTPI